MTGRRNGLKENSSNRTKASKVGGNIPGINLIPLTLDF
jgi:hypothetical protein